MRAATALLLAALPLAGCLAEDAAPPAAPGTATVHGVVTDLGLAPIPRALVRLLGTNETLLTATDGSFVFPGVAGDAALVHATADGFFGATRRASLVGGDAELRIALEPVPIEEPYSVAMEHEGFVSCAATARIGGEGAEGDVVSCHGGDPNDKRELSFEVPVEEGAWGAVLELKWTPAQPFATRFHFSASIAGSAGERILGGVEGDGYARILVPPSVGRELLEPQATLRTLVSPAPSLLDEEAFAGVGLAVAQPFRVVVTIFYHGAPPAAYTVFEG